MQILQVFFLQDLQDLAINLAHIYKVLHKNEALLARYKNHWKFLQAKL